MEQFEGSSLAHDLQTSLQLYPILSQQIISPPSPSSLCHDAFDSCLSASQSASATATHTPAAVALPPSTLATLIISAPIPRLDWFGQCENTLAGASLDPRLFDGNDHSVIERCQSWHKGLFDGEQRSHNALCGG